MNCHLFWEGFVSKLDRTIDLFLEREFFFQNIFSIEAFGLFQCEVKIFFQDLQYFSRFLPPNPLFFQVFQVWTCFSRFSRFSRCGGNPAQHNQSRWPGAKYSTQQKCPFSRSANCARSGLFWCKWLGLGWEAARTILTKDLESSQPIQSRQRSRSSSHRLHFWPGCSESKIQLRSWIFTPKQLWKVCVFCWCAWFCNGSCLNAVPYSSCALRSRMAHGPFCSGTSSSRTSSDIFWRRLDRNVPTMCI